MDCNIIRSYSENKVSENHTNSIFNNYPKLINNINNIKSSDSIKSNENKQSKNFIQLNKKQHIKTTTNTHKTISSLNYCFTPTNYPLMDMVNLIFKKVKT